MSDRSTPDLLSDESLVGRVADEFTERLQRGERPDVEDYARRYPRVADLLREVLPALQAMASESSCPESAVQRADALTGCLGDYRLGRELGRGGMGVVYEAVQLSLNRRVALKVLPFAAALDARQLQRFKNEAQAAAHLHHTHIVPVFGVGSDRGVHYYAMQFIEGESLAALIQEQRQAAGLTGEDPPAGTGSPAGGVLSGRSCPAQRGTAGPRADPEAPPVRAPADDTARAGTTLVAPGAGTPATDFRTLAHLGIQAAEALEHAHQLGVVHRDVKPANLLVDLRGHLWITDFGLAQLQGGDTGLTLTGDVVGTLRYMSPEQALGRRAAVDQRTDVYSLGVTLYELLTLCPAFGGRDRAELLRRVSFDEPAPPRRLNAAVPRELETVVLKAMAKAPEDRYASAQELADDLQRFLDDRPIRARRPTLTQRAARLARRHQAVLRAVAIVVLLALAACAVLEWHAFRVTESAYRGEAAERHRAEDNLRLAMHAMDQVYQRSVRIGAMHDPQRDPQEVPLLQDTLAFYERFAERNRDNPEVEAETATAYERVAELAHTLHRPTQAESACRQAIARFTTLRAAEPGKAAYRLDLARSLNQLGLVLQDLGHSGEAEQTYLQSLEQLQQLVAEGPNDRDRVEALAKCYLSLAVCYMDVLRVAEAEQTYRKALAFQERLCNDSPDVPRYHHDLAGIRGNFALLLWRSGRLEEAEAGFDQALAGLKQLAARYDDPWYRVRLGQTLDRLGGFYKETGRPGAAEAAYRGACETARLLVKDYPNVPLYKLDLAAGRHELAMVLADLGKLSEAKDLAATAVAALEELVKQLPDVPICRATLSDACINEGVLLWRLRDSAAAEACYRRGFALRIALAEELPDTPDHRDRAAGACINLGTLLRVGGRFREAEREFRLAATLSTELVGHYPGVIEYRHRRGVSRIALGLGLADAGRLAEAEEALRDGIAVEEVLAGRFPRVPEYRDWTARTGTRLAALLRKTHRPAEADEAEQRAVARFEELAAEFPELPQYRQDLTTLFDDRGSALHAESRHREAERAYRVAIAHADRLAADFPSSGEYGQQRAVCRCHLATVLAALGRPGEAEEVLVVALHQCPDLADAHNGLAWLLATCPDPTHRDPDRALDAACKAVALAPRSADCWNTLGVALFRTGDWRGARGALETGVRLRLKADARDGFFLAMVCWRLGERDEATRWYEYASHRQEASRPGAEEVSGFWAEAADLLGLSGRTAARPPPTL
jgi:serine/threonine protein kinase/Tfp pilus assembly protein PilF